MGFERDRNRRSPVSAQVLSNAHVERFGSKTAEERIGFNWRDPAWLVNWQRKGNGANVNDRYRNTEGRRKAAGHSHGRQGLLDRRRVDDIDAVGPNGRRVALDVREERPLGGHRGGLDHWVHDDLNNPTLGAGTLGSH